VKTIGQGRAIGKQWASGRRSQGQGRGICSLLVARNSRPSAAGEFARSASRGIAAEGRGGSKAPSFQALT